MPITNWKINFVVGTRYDIAHGRRKEREKDTQMERGNLTYTWTCANGKLARKKSRSAYRYGLYFIRNLRISSTT